MHAHFSRSYLSRMFAVGALLLLLPLHSLAAPIGTGSVNGSGAYDTTINWNDQYPGTASGTVDGITVTARVLPTLNVTFSTGTLSLGTLVPDVASTGSLTIEVGTNAVDGVTITARSSSGGLTSLSDPAFQINSLTNDGLAESYRFVSSLGPVDSTTVGFTSSATLSTEVNNNSTQHLVYTSNRPQPLAAQNDINFFVEATAETVTPAGDYRDSLNFTITGTF